MRLLRWVLIVSLLVVATLAACRGSPGSTPSPSTTVGIPPEPPARGPAGKDAAAPAGARPDGGAPAFDPSDRAFIADPESFTPKLPPRPGDWLERFPETGTTFEEYVRSHPVTRTAQRDKIVLQPLGPFREDERKLLATLREYTAVFFDCPVIVAPDLPLPQKGRRSRQEGGQRWTQHHTQVILHEVLAPRLPSDAVAYLGITMGDLYPEASWNFVFGEATLDERVGVYSLVRYFPGFTGEKDTPAARTLGLLRSFKVLPHETGHMFGLHHCARFECLMNGTNSLDETDRSSGTLCPVCLKKLDWNLRFDVRRRYARLLSVYQREGLTELARWTEARLQKIGPER
jgi:archaemetzincin